jgi:hypothetical protein
MAADFRGELGGGLLLSRPKYQAVASAFLRLPGFTQREKTRIRQRIIELYDLLRPSLYSYLCSIGMSADQAEDIIQETFLRLVQHLRTGKGFFANFEETYLSQRALFDELAGRLQLACLQIAKHPRTFHTQKRAAGPASARSRSRLPGSRLASGKSQPVIAPSSCVKARPKTRAKVSLGLFSAP